MEPNISKPNPIKSLAGQTAVYGMGTIIPRLLNYLLVPFYTRVFVQAEYGQITELYAYVAFLLVLLTYGMETAFFRFAKKHEGTSVFNTLWTSVILTTLVFVVVMLFVHRSISTAIGYESESAFMMLIALIVAFDAITAIPFALLRQQNKARNFALLKIANVAINISLNVLFLLVIPETAAQWSSQILGPGSGMVVWVFVANLLASISTLVLLMPFVRAFRWRIDPSILKPALNYALPVLVVGLAGMVNEVMDKLLLKHLLPDPDTALAQVGVYGANYKLAVLMTLFIQMFRYAVEPFFFANAEKKESPELFARVTNLFIVFGLAIFLLVTLYIDFFKLLIGPEFHEGLHIVPIILMANLFYGVFFNLSVWYKVTDRTRYGAVISVAGAVVTLFLNIWLIPLWGYVGSAWAHLVCYFMMMTISYFWGKRFYPVPYKLKSAFFYTLLGLLIFAIAQLSEMVGIEALVLNSAMFAVFMGIVFFNERKHFIQS